MKKQTSANNDFLKKVKKVFNSKIYKHASLLVNHNSEEDAKNYVSKFINCSLDEIYAEFTGKNKVEKMPVRSGEYQMHPFSGIQGVRWITVKTGNITVHIPDMRVQKMNILKGMFVGLYI